MDRESRGCDRFLGKVTRERLAFEKRCHRGTGQLIISTGRAIIVTLWRIILSGWIAQVTGKLDISGPWLDIVSGG